MCEHHKPGPVKLRDAELTHAFNLALDSGGVPRGVRARLVAQIGCGSIEAAPHLVLAEGLEALAEQLLEVCDAPVHLARVVHKAVVITPGFRLHCRLCAVTVVCASPQRVSQHRVDALKLLEQFFCVLFCLVLFCCEKRRKRTQKSRERDEKTNIIARVFVWMVLECKLQIRLFHLDLACVLADAQKLVKVLGVL